MQAFRDALLLQSSVNGAAVPGAEEASAAAAVQEAKLADAACQVSSTGIDAQQSRKCGGSLTAGIPPAIVASGAEEQSQALQEAAAAKAEAANLKVCHHLCTLTCVQLAPFRIVLNPIKCIKRSTVGQ